MNKNFLFYFFCFCFIFTIESYSQPKKVLMIEGPFFNPWYIHALNDDSLLVVDVKNNREALQLLSTTDGKILNSQRIGRGPGEISPDGAKIINITTNSVSLWDSGSKQLLKYSRNLNYKNSLLIDLPIMYLAAMGDSLAFGSTSFPAKNFLHLYSIGENGLSSEPIKTFSTDVNKKLNPLSENYLLQQGPFLVDNEALYIGFDFSSIIIKVSPDSIEYINGEPANIPLPGYDAVKVEGNARTTSSPDIAKYPQSSLDFATDRNYLYVLHSGKKLEAGRLKQIWLATTGKLGEIIEDLDYSTKIFLYNKESGDYLRTINLPQKATKIAVSENYIFALSLNQDELPVVIGYTKDSLK